MAPWRAPGMRAVRSELDCLRIRGGAQGGSGLAVSRLTPRAGHFAVGGYDRRIWSILAFRSATTRRGGWTSESRHASAIARSVAASDGCRGAIGGGSAVVTFFR